MQYGQLSDAWTTISNDNSANRVARGACLRPVVSLKSGVTVNAIEID